MINIRLMEKNDVDRVRELVFKVMSRKSGKKYINNETNFTIVAELDSEIVGVATIFIHDNEIIDEKTYFVSNLCVDPDYQRIGVATKLLDYIEDLGKQENIKYIYTLIPIKYYEANQLFERLNYDIKNMNCYRKELS